jgi:protein O-mannosyl-transferase
MISPSETRRSKLRSTAPSPAPGWRSTLLYCTLLVVATGAVYSQVGNLSFINIDDPEYASQNSHVQAGLSSAGLRWSLSIHDCNWIPLTWLSLMLNSQIFGTEPVGYHVTNVILHTANALILFVTLAGATGSNSRSFFIAALFALHPLHVESVAWVAERKDVLSICFGLLALRAYVRYAQAGQAWRYAASLLLFVCSLLSKPTLVTLPFVLLLLDYWPLQRLGRGAPAVSAQDRKGVRRDSEQLASASSVPKSLLNSIADKIPFFTAATAFSVVAMFAQSRGGAMAAPYTLGVRIQNAVCVYVAYLEKLAYPANLSVYYPHPGHAITWAHLALASVVLLAVTATAIAFIRRLPFLFVGWFWYLGTLVPMIGFVQIGTQQMADRYTYFPSIGIFLAAAWLLPALVPAGFFRERVLPLAAIAALVLYSAIAFSQVSYWHDSVTLLRHSQSCTRDNSAIHEFLAAALLGDNLPEEAVPEYQAAIRLGAPYAPLHSGLAAAYEVLGRKDEALGEYRVAATLDPRSVDASNGIAHILSERKEFAEARRYMERAVELDADNPVNYVNLAFLCGKTGDFAAALSYAEQGRQLNPQLYACDLEAARALRGLGRFDEAIGRLQHLAEVAPDDALVQQELTQTREQKQAASVKPAIK